MSDKTFTGALTLPGKQLIKIDFDEHGGVIVDESQHNGNYMEGPTA